MTDQNIEDIITDAEMIHVHANSDFGNMTPRGVLQKGLQLVEGGFHCGSTMRRILIDHKLVGVHRNGRKLILNVKGKRYLAALSQKAEAVK